MTAAEFAASFVALYAAHQIADHWVQTEHQAATKGCAGRRGRVACAAHVGTYTATAAVSLALTFWVCGMHPDTLRVGAGLAASALTHYLADRRTPLRLIAEAVGHRPFFHLGMPRPGRDDNPSLGTGAYAMDQSWHIWWLFIAALIMS
jgi:hypothetical protein